MLPVFVISMRVTFEAVVEVDAKIVIIIDQNTIKFMTDNKLILLRSKYEAVLIFSSIIYVQVERKNYIFFYCLAKIFF